VKKILSLLLLFYINLFGESIHVAVAANVSYAIKALTSEFEKEYPHIKVETTLGSSGKLTSQIKHGAPYDIFMSANMRYPETLYRDGFASSEVVIYAQGALVLFSRTKREFSKGIYTLLEPEVKRVAMGNPKTAPYGKAAKELLINAKIYNQVKPKLIYGESISQTLLYAMRAAEMGFIAKSALYAKSMRHFKYNQNWIDIDKSLYNPISQGIILLKKAKSNPDAKLFYDFILSKRAKEIFKKFGYTTP